MGIEHIERHLLAERLCLARTRRGRVHAVALAEMQVQRNYVHRRRVRPGVMDAEDRSLCNRIGIKKFCWCTGREGERRKTYPSDCIPGPIVPNLKPFQIVSRFRSASAFFMDVSDARGPHLSAAE